MNCLLANSIKGRAAGFVCPSLFFLSALSTFVARAADPDPGTGSPVQIEWSLPASEGTPQSFTVPGLDEKLVNELNAAEFSTTEWQRLFSASVDQADPLLAIEQPAMAGRYSATGSTITFRPRFPLSPGTRYRATFNPEVIRDFQNTGNLKPSSRVFTVPATDPTPTTSVMEIFPSASVLPENLLKFYLHFSAPMSSHNIHRHIRLMNEDNEPVALPFLELDDPLWNLDMTQLTLFIDPGRIKREVKPLEEIGPSLIEGKTFRLVIDQQWKDATGNPLVNSFEKNFSVTSADRTSPDLNSWSITVPPRGTRRPVQVDFLESMDHALAQRMIRIEDTAGTEITGVIQLAHDDREWSFVPDQGWSPGEYVLSVQTIIEDLAGNNIGKLFEVDLRRETGLRPLPRFARRKFVVQ